MNCGSVDSLKVSTRWGLSPNARQIRLIADCDIPVARANDRVDQWVASVGAVSRVATSTCSTWVSVMVRVAPGLIGQALQPTGDKPRPPLGHRRPRDAQPGGDRGVAGALGTGQYDPQQRNANA
jgi:hypothetical protein